MKPMRMLTLLALLSVLPACAASMRSGETAGLRLDPPPPELVQEIPAPVRLPPRAMTQAEVERAWISDRAALVTGRRRHGALVRFYDTRDAALRGGSMVITPTN